MHTEYQPPTGPISHKKTVFHSHISTLRPLLCSPSILYVRLLCRFPQDSPSPFPPWGTVTVRSTYLLSASADPHFLLN